MKKKIASMQKKQSKMHISRLKVSISVNPMFFSLSQNSWAVCQAYIS